MENQTLVKKICPTATQKWIKNGALLVDVRERDEVSALSFNVPIIITIPLSEFEERFNEIPSNQDIIVVCKDGKRSLRAFGFLVNHGYTNVVSMKHGTTRWVQKGFPTIGNTSIFSESGACCSTSGCC